LALEKKLNDLPPALENGCARGNVGNTSDGRGNEDQSPATLVAERE